MLAFYAFPAEHWPKLRSTNPLERFNREIGRRTDVVGIFPDDASVIRLVSMLAIEANDEWLVGRSYISRGSMTRSRGSLGRSLPIMSVEERVPNERLRHARSLKGWSQAKLAEEVGTSFEMVSRWERGVTISTLYFRAQLCASLGMTTAEELGLAHDFSEQLAIPTSFRVSCLLLC